MIKRQKIIIGCSTAALLAAAIFVFNTGKTDTPKDVGTILNENQRIPYLNLCGWDAEEISQKDIRIPQEFTGFYKEYAALQKDQGFNLEKFKGCNAIQITYNISNYTDNDNVRAELTFCDDTLIGASIYENSPEGFRQAIKD